MITQHSVRFKKIWLQCLLIACGLLAVFLGFISLISVWIGFGHMHQSGFWVPIIAGITLFGAVFWGFLHITRYILSQMKEEGVVNI